MKSWIKCLEVGKELDSNRMKNELEKTKMRTIRYRIQDRKTDELHIILSVRVVCS